MITDGQHPLPHVSAGLKDITAKAHVVGVEPRTAEQIRRGTGRSRRE